MIRRFGATGLLLAPAAWVATEYLRAHIFGGFPWIPLGNAVVTLLPIAQLASVGGVYRSVVAPGDCCTRRFALAARQHRPAPPAAAVAAALALVAGTSLWGCGADQRQPADARGRADHASG